VRDIGADGTIVPIRENAHSGVSCACAAKSEAVERETEDGEAEAAAQDACHTKAGEPEDADRKPVLFDLYSGTGTISQLMAKSARKVVGVEIVEEAVQAARENAAMNGITNCEFIAGDVLKVIDQIPDKPDVIVLDPPRDGIHPKALPKILKYQVPNILYISCKPTSLARDIPAFYLAGYRLQKAVCVDMFPWTTGVETVVQLSKGNISSQNVRVEFSLEDMDMSRFQQGATYEQIQAWVQEKYGFHVTHLNIAQVKRKHGIIERQNYNKPKSPDSKQPGCPEDKTRAIETALKHFQMI